MVCQNEVHYKAFFYRVIGEHYSSVIFSAGDGYIQWITQGASLKGHITLGNNMPTNIKSSLYSHQDSYN